jgi:colanic acid biosynthesis glycosyl transferase WcaI
MKILFLSQYYPPETGAAPLRAYHFATKLAAAGHDVTVVTGMPNHPSGVKPPEYRRRLLSRERRDGVRIVRSYVYATPRKTFRTRMANQISFAISALGGGLTAGTCDVILVTSPPLFLGITAWFLGLLKGAPYVLDVRDYWPHAAVELGQLKNRSFIRMAERLEGFLYRRAARVVAVTPGMLRLMLARGIQQHRVVLITNAADLDRFSPAEARPAEEGSVRTVLYSGTHGLVHGMGVILDAAEILRGEAGIRFLLVGDGAEKDNLVADARRRGLTNVSFLPSQQPEQLAETIRSADVCLATTTPGTFSEGTIPVKIFDYLACGKPVIAAVGGDAKVVIEASCAGVVVEPGDAKGLADAVRALIADSDRRERLGRRGRDYVESEYSRARTAAKMESVLAEIVGAERVLGASRLRFRHYLAAKYTFDFVGALLVVVLASPIFGILSLLVRLDSPGRALFLQRRIGVYSQEFRIRKFRTMHRHAPDIATDLMMIEPTDYTTRVGRFLRRTSLDEFPNFWNILRGDMSIVGPRPALYNQDDLIEARRRSAADLMRPGLTGWAQINGRDSITLEEKVRLDEFYVRHCSLLLDLKILIRTLSVMLNEETKDGRGNAGDDGPEEPLVDT